LSPPYSLPKTPFETLLRNSVGLEWGIFSETMENTSLYPTTISRRAPGGADGYDAVTADALKVQIKANHSSSTMADSGLVCAM
jgi:hypothetical protein